MRDGGSAPGLSASATAFNSRKDRAF